ncbi:SDR family NAD(P)-dependent oxidoreductase [Pseudoflavitalea sp. G-6-1-2]|uniref:SDR family NAD(P)-dependent oxidoreductase n=1 Tax=Pseudoflavitalea sp. G-6-1-2 TaxID=2728841 RepID=UPI00146F6C22|nr:SDR family NAD(P)-dependent oxidoreductase [Pseudoflavitalea sp. G-6-1-2]NML20311.1 SDR family NAD(P)-dependent oxidoreductase [Pseudoflavitalea sp. G-6-1-2]
MSKTIIITGANGGLGSAVVKRFLTSEDYHVIAVDHSKDRNSFAEGHARYEFHVVNVGDETETSTFIDAMISKHKKIDGALLLVGGFAMGNIDTTDGQAIKDQFHINFETAYYTARPLFNHMHQHGYGRIVLIGSKPALQPAAGKNVLAYAIAKSMLFKLAELLNESAKGTNVVCSVIAPSTIDTPTNRRDMPDADTSKWVKGEQIADLMEFICSDKGDPLRESVYKIYNNA